MSYRYEKTDTGTDLILEGFEYGIARSPHRGIANLQNVNIDTETGEVMGSFARARQDQTTNTGSLTQVNTNTVTINSTLLAGQLITITDAGTTGLSGDYYYLGNGKLFDDNVCPDDPDNATVVTGITSGTATFSVKVLGNPIDKATEVYLDSSGNQQTRYFILDSNSVIWCHDTKSLSNYPTPNWFYVIDLGSNYSGIAVYNGWLVNFKNTANATVASTWRLTSLLNSTGVEINALALSSTNVHRCLVGKQGKLYVTDGNYIASYFANTSLITGAANVQSYCEYSGGATNSTIVANIGGSLPYLGNGSTVRVPAIFFSSGSLPSAITANTIYYLESSFSGSHQYQFQVYAAASGGSALNMSTGATGRGFLNTFSPRKNSGSTALMTFTPQRLNLPFTETAQCLAEVGNTVLVGGTSNTIYPWNQVDPIPQDIIPLPEGNTTKIVTVNSLAYIFAGNKGNIYLTNGSSASLVLKVPDYCAGIAGTPKTYIEPYFSWGDAMYCRGRVYFSILDETASKTGVCGDVWSFIPSQNFAYDQDTGLALRLENQNSYGAYTGYCPLLIPALNQQAIGTQYWSAWSSNPTGSSTYGIDFTDTVSVTSYVFETDLVPTGTMLKKKTYMQVEYKLATPFATGESIALYYRLNSTDSWITCGSPITETSKVGGYFETPFENTQWIQIRGVVTLTGDSTSSFGRLRQIIVR